MRASDIRKLNRQKNGYGPAALVLQGGGALGAYQAGVYQILSEHGCEPDWVCGVSIGTINAAFIAGNEPKDRLPRLKAFWERTTCAFTWPAPAWDTTARRFFNAVSSGASVLAGQPGLFQPRLPPAAWLQRRSPDVVSVYDTSALRETLEELVDFGRINAGRTRLSLGAVSVSTGNGIYFDSAERAITADHVMASGALHPGFPAICIDGEFYWDGGLISNTPLVHVLDEGPKRDTLVFQVDLFDARGELPGDAIEVEERRKHIAFSSRTRFSTDHFQELHRLRRAVVKPFEQLPLHARQDAEVQRLRDLGMPHAVSIVHLISRSRNFECMAIDCEFSLWIEPAAEEDGVRIFDLAGKGAD
ncbi:patatin-like phospholipase [Sinorhizobium sp. KGO-5]|uniref:patatin-like phospholipase family protein n=1 Tax=Sinorhizobium sp. KGO-5 TaxID=1470810 RepID=UPI002949C196|nr:patatin-like phospholipase [Sinorhizobium sp. KGO-5]